jgi:hypothetical protein
MLEELPLLILCAPGSAVRGLGRPGLLRCRQGGLTCLASDRARARRGPVGPEGQEGLDSTLLEFYGPSNPVPGAYKY